MRHTATFGERPPACDGVVTRSHRAFTDGRSGFINDGVCRTRPPLTLFNFMATHQPQISLFLLYMSWDTKYLPPRLCAMSRRLPSLKKRQGQIHINRSRSSRLSTSFALGGTSSVAPVTSGLPESHSTPEAPTKCDGMMINARYVFLYSLNSIDPARPASRLRLPSVGRRVPHLLLRDFQSHSRPQRRPRNVTVW